MKLRGRERKPMKRFVLLLVLGVAAVARAAPLQTDPVNSHYFQFRGEPTVLVGSSEHYGAVLNADFDYVQYLNTIQADGLNATRIFTGAYIELPGRFAPEFDLEIVDNVLAPKPGSFLAPWARNPSASGDGPGKFDLTRWDDAYFRRLIDFVKEAGKRGIVVEVSLFSDYYSEWLWGVSPLNVRNNINSIGALPVDKVLTMEDERLVTAQDAMVRRIIEALRDFDNVYYEICNEPDEARVSIGWQRHVAEVVSDTEAASKVHHLIAQEFPEGTGEIGEVVPQASLYVFHYLRVPAPMRLNYSRNMPLGVNENGMDGIGDAPYRIQAWQTLLSGGALSIGLDYSFTVDHPEGGYVLPASQPGGGSSTLRKQLGILRSFMQGMNFLQMSPNTSAIQSKLPSGTSVNILADDGEEYAIYIHRGRAVPFKNLHIFQYDVDSAMRKTSIALKLSPGPYRAQWISTKTGRVEKEAYVVVDQKHLHVTSPSYSEDIALRITRRDDRADQ